jgi:alkanesulfonate monooxygenase
VGRFQPAARWPGAGIVGSYEQCAARLDELIARGTDAFILAGTPHLEEAYRIGEEVLPLLGRQAEALLHAAE